MIDVKRKFFGESWHANYFVKLICLDILFLFSVFALSNVSQSKSLTNITLSHGLVFDNGITIADHTIEGKIDSKDVVLQLSDKYKIFIKSDCYNDGCEEDINYRKVNLESLRKGNEKKIHINDPVVVILNKLGVVKKIVIVRIPE